MASDVKIERCLSTQDQSVDFASAPVSASHHLWCSMRSPRVRRSRRGETTSGSLTDWDRLTGVTLRRANSCTEVQGRRIAARDRHDLHSTHVLAAHQHLVRLRHGTTCQLLDVRVQHGALVSGDAQEVPNARLGFLWRRKAAVVVSIEPHLVARDWTKVLTHVRVTLIQFRRDVGGRPHQSSIASSGTRSLGLTCGCLPSSPANLAYIVCRGSGFASGAPSASLPSITPSRVTPPAERVV